MRVEFVEMREGLGGYVKTVQGNEVGKWVMETNRLYINDKADTNIGIAKEMIRHELTHVKQARDGRFYVRTKENNGESSGYYFDGKLVITLNVKRQPLKGQIATINPSLLKKRSN